MAVSLDDDPPSQGPICPVCFRDYSDNETELIPRILQCGHTYCTRKPPKTSCVEKQPVEFILNGITETFIAVKRE